MCQNILAIDFYLASYQIKSTDNKPGWKQTFPFLQSVSKGKEQIIYNAAIFTCRQDLSVKALGKRKQGPYYKQAYFQVCTNSNFLGVQGSIPRRPWFIILSRNGLSITCWLNVNIVRAWEKDQIFLLVFGGCFYRDRHSFRLSHPSPAVNHTHKFWHLSNLHFTQP